MSINIIYWFTVRGLNSSKNSVSLSLRNDGVYKSGQRGFSLLELIIVIVVIGILVAIAIPIFGGVQDDAKQSAVEAAASNGSVTVQAALSNGENPSYALRNSDTSDDIQLDLLSGVAGNLDSICVSAQWIGDSDIIAAAGPGCDGWYVDDDGSITPPPVRGDGSNDDENFESTMVTTWRVENSRSDGLTVNLPITGNVSTNIDWGDGSDPVSANGNYPSYTYDSPGFYEIKIEGSFSYWGLDNVRTINERNNLIGDEPWLETAQEGLMSVDYWDDSIGLKSASFAFASSLTYVTEIPSTVNSMNHMFWHADSFNQPIGHWDVSNVNYMSETFREAHSFDQPLDDWDVSNVVNMRSLFNSAHRFDQNLRSWDVSNVKDMRWMFQESRFNQDIGNWDLSSVERIRRIFYENTDFNQDISTWEIGELTDMYGMFEGASAFNQDISTWDVSQVTGMRWTFQGATSFDQDISNWDVSNVNDMYGMFIDASSFNQDLSGWDVSKVENPGSPFDSNSGLDPENRPNF